MKRSERREFRRVAVDMRVAEEFDGVVEAARAVDLCELGMRYVKPASAKDVRGQEVMLEFCLPGEMVPVRVLGWVADEQVLGPDRFTSVNFAFSTDRDSERICSHLARQASA